MKIVKENLSDGEIVVIPQDSDDLYHIYHIVNQGDRVRSKTSRKMKDTGDRISMWMTIEVEETEFHGFGETIRIRGRILDATEENVSLGSYHSITIELLNQLSIFKSEWHNSELSRLRNAQMGKSSPVVVVSMDDERALVTQVGSHASKVLLDLEPGIPRKGNDVEGHVAGKKDYFEQLASFLRQLRDDGVARYIVIGGPGFIKDEFYDFLKRAHRDLVTDLSVVDTASIGQAGVREIVLSKIPDHFTAGETAKQQSELMQRVLEIMGKDTNEVAYGSNLGKALEMGAIDKLLVLDNLLHETIEKRQEIEDLMTDVEQMGGKSILMSSEMDESTTEMLSALGGVVAILRFPLPL